MTDDKKITKTIGEEPASGGGIEAQDQPNEAHEPQNQPGAVQRRSP